MPLYVWCDTYQARAGILYIRASWGYNALIMQKLTFHLFSFLLNAESLWYLSLIHI